MKTLLVTGGAGFIGSGFIHHMLSEHAYRVVNLDLLTYAGNLERLSDIEKNPRLTFVRGDVRDRGLVEKLFAEYEFDAVVNFAAESYVDRSLIDPDLFLKTNVGGTLVLLDAAKRSWRTKSGSNSYRSGVKFVQCSAADVYGDLGEAGSFTESSPLAPRNPYAASKAGADLLAQSYFEAYGLPITITRSPITYGPGQFPEKLLPMVIANAAGRAKIPLYGDGRQVRDWLYLDDHCRALDAVLHRGEAGQVYHIGGGDERTNLDLVRLTLAALNASEDLIYHLPDRPVHERRVVLDTRKIAEELNWSPAVDLVKGIDLTAKWYKDNPEWVRGVTSGAYEDYYRLYYLDAAR